MRTLPITPAGLYDWFPCADVEHPFAGDPYWQLQAFGTLIAVQIFRLVPEGPTQQQALLELRKTIDTCLLVVPKPPEDTIQRIISP
jgi:hypothetical protein